MRGDRVQEIVVAAGVDGEGGVGVWMRVRVWSGRGVGGDFDCGHVVAGVVGGVEFDWRVCFGVLSRGDGMARACFEMFWEADGVVDIVGG